MPASEAQIRANKQNAQRSTGPKSEEGKAASHANSYKHGLTGSGVVVSPSDAAEIDRRAASFVDELKPSGEVGHALARLAAVMSVRMDRAVEYENAALTERVRRAEADFVAPEGVESAEAAKLREQAGKLALFDSSKEACLARKYEAAAIRGFFRAIKELRQIEKAAEAAREAAPPVEDPAIREALGSLLQLEKRSEKLEASFLELDRMTSLKRPNPVLSPRFPDDRDVFDVPLAIGKRS